MEYSEQFSEERMSKLEEVQLEMTQNEKEKNITKNKIEYALVTCRKFLKHLYL